MLSLTPTERLQAAQDMVDTVEALHRSPKHSGFESLRSLWLVTLSGAKRSRRVWEGVLAASSRIASGTSERWRSAACINSKPSSQLG